MSESLLLSVAIFVFLMMAIGLGLTIREFRHGQPKRQDEMARLHNSRSQPSQSLDAA